MKRKDILLLSRKPEIHSTKRLVEELSSRRLSFRLEDPETDSYGDPLVVIPRLGTWRFFETIQKLNRQNFRFLNSPDAYMKARNKWTCMQELARADIPTPLSQMFHRDEFSLIDLEFPFVLKDIFSSQGLGVFLIQSGKDLAEALAAKPLLEDFLVQQYVRESHGEDIRIFVTASGAHWGMKRKNMSGDFRSNLSTGGKAFREEITSEEIELSLQSLKIFGLDYAGVDILRSSNGPLIIEVNPCPGFQGIETIHGPVIAPAIVDLAVK